MGAKKEELLSIRPAGRLILTIGRDLIKSPAAALLELVKNAYDADSPSVSVSIIADRENERINISIEDTGHGMSKSVVKNVWLVPATSDKLRRKRSPKGRVLQGRKGVGRFAAAILGETLRLETIADNKKTSVSLDWRMFEHAKFLDKVKVNIESERVDSLSGTRLKIVGENEYLAQWNDRQLERLEYELKKLIPPTADEANGALFIGEQFSIRLTISGFGEKDKDEDLRPFPLLALYDYRIYGELSSDGRGKFTYACQKIQNVQDEHITVELGATGCGALRFDIRVYDRDRAAIEQLIKRGFRDDKGNYADDLTARRVLSAASGIGVYRNGFRISPLGDAEYDWLELNKKRVQAPSRCIGSDQVIGCIHIEAEEASGLIEKSARDGLRENASYECFKRCASEVVNLLEQRRFAFRQKEGYGRKLQKLGVKLTAAFGFDDFRARITKQLQKARVAENTIAEIERYISSKEEEQAQILDDVGATIALYQGQATLGKIINIVIHEGRRPLNYLKNQIPNIRYYHDKYNQTKDELNFIEVDRLLTGTETQVKCFSDLFGRIDPLAISARKNQRDEKLHSIIEDSIKVFENELRAKNIHCIVDCDDELTMKCWRQDMQAVFVNLIENSIFWIEEKKSSVRKISIEVGRNADGELQVDYRDTGPGIPDDLIKSEIIFEPNFSTKVAGTGLGLTIAGEAAQRNQLQLIALSSRSGAYFRLVSTVEKKESK